MDRNMINEAASDFCNEFGSIDAADKHDGQESEFRDDLTQLYLNEIHTTPLLQPKEEVSLAMAMRKGDFAARQRMIAANLRLVVNIAKHYQRRGVPFDDLIEEGNLGLMHALEKYDPESGFRVSTYASWWIRHYIERTIMKQSRTIRLPVHVIGKLNRVLRSLRKFGAQGNVESSEDINAVARLLDTPANEIRQLLKLNENTISLDTPLEMDPEASMLDAIPSEESADPEWQCQQVEIEQCIANWVSHLSEKQRLVIEHRYGLNGYEPCTLGDLAYKLGLTRSRVGQIQLEALGALRQRMSREGITCTAVL